MCVKRGYTLLVLLAFVSCLLGIATCGVFAAERITVTDMGKRMVEVPSNPQRIICLSSGTLRLIVYLGAAGRVVGVEAFEQTRPGARPYILAHPELAKLPLSLIHI